MDADYYFAAGRRLAEGHGFTEMILWNYLDNPTGIPHPSFAYWMPLASILSAVGMLLTNAFGFSSGRLMFILISSVIPPLTAYLGQSITNRFAYAFAAGFLAVFSGYYIPYASTTDTFFIYMFLGIVFLLILGYGLKNKSPSGRNIMSIGLGIVAGLAHLTRVDGFIWLLMAMIVIVFLEGKINKRFFGSISLIACGYLLIMLPWLLRNYYVFGSPLAPGGNRSLWLITYDQIYSFPASKLNMESWLQSGLLDILQKRFDALVWNLETMWAVQGMIFLLPFILIGLWSYRSDLRIKIGVISWIVTFLIMTFVFPFAGSRGGFFHSGAALQPLWWIAAPVGIEKSVVWVETKRNWRKGEAFNVFLIGSILICFLLSGLLLTQRVLLAQGWGFEADRYVKVESLINRTSPIGLDPVMVVNPPGYYIASNRPSIAIPNEPLPVVISVAEKYGAKYLILEDNETPSPLLEVFLNPDTYPTLKYLGEVDGAKIFAIP